MFKYSWSVLCIIYINVYKQQRSFNHMYDKQSTLYTKTNEFKWSAHVLWMNEWNVVAFFCVCCPFEVFFICLAMYLLSVYSETKKTYAGTVMTEKRRVPKGKVGMILKKYNKKNGRYISASCLCFFLYIIKAIHSKVVSFGWIYRHCCFIHAVLAQIIL